MGMTNVKAYDDGNLLAGRVDGESGRTGENKIGLSRFKNPFFKKLQAVKKSEEWSVFACAEVNAAYLLTVFFDTRLKDVRIEKAVDGHLLKMPCKNCSQWLEEVGNSRTFRIRDEFTLSEAQEGESRVPRNGNQPGEAFPALSTPSLAASSSEPAKPGGAWAKGSPLK